MPCRPRTLSTVLLAGLVGTTAALASDIGQQIANQVSVTSYRHYLDDMLYTHNGDSRGPGGAEHDLARDNILTTFESFGLDAELEPFVYQGGTAYNVVATQWGTIQPDVQYVVGAHYDSVSNPGADDDASGVAALLEIARVLSQYQTECSVRYVAFDLEEEGLVGSQAYVADHARDDIRGMVQLDMIAWNNGNYRAVVAGTTCSNDFKNAVAAAITEYGGNLAPVVQGPLGSGGSDHDPFEDAGFPACLLIEYRYSYNPCYHKACDSVDTTNYINYNFAADHTRSVAGFLADVAGVHTLGDCNDDDLADDLQIQADPTLDCNENGVLDVCEPGGDQDCNNNGVPDVCDIFAGTSQDSDGNAIPDECQTQRLVPSQYATIQAALNAASDHDVIVVANGTYTGSSNRNLNFNGKAVTLRSAGSPAQCTIDCQNSGRAFVFDSNESPQTRIEGFTIRNGSASSGGAAFLTCGASPTFVNCTFTSNTADVGGALYGEIGAKPRLTACTLTGNTADVSEGGAIYCDGWPTLTDCAITNNFAAVGGAGIHTGDGAPLITGCTFTGNDSAGNGGGLNVRDAFIVDCTIADNTAAGLGGGIYALDGTIDLCVIAANLADWGGGVETDGTIRNCLITRNTAKYGGGLRCGGAATVLNCTIFANSANYYGGGLVSDSAGGLTAASCIFWGNSAPQGAQLALPYSWTNLTISRSDAAGGQAAVYVVDGAVLNWGVGNLNADPRFADADGPDNNPVTWQDNNLRLRADSPCIDAGDPAAPFGPLAVDLEGRKRVWDGNRDGSVIVDMGAYEYGAKSWTAGNGHPPSGNGLGSP